MWFWIIIGMLILLMLSLFAQALLSGRDTASNKEDNAAEFDLQLYRDQLSGVERDLERGVVGIDEAARIKIEVSRRLLEADKAAHVAQTAAGKTSTPGAATYGALIVCAGILIGSVAVYKGIGAAGYPDFPLQQRIDDADKSRLERPDQAKAEASIPPSTIEVDPRHEALLEKLRVAISTRPDDLKGHQLLAGNEAAIGNYIAAYHAHSRVLELMGDEATAADYSDLADLMVMAAGGYVSPEAEAALKQALLRDENDGKARYYSGLMYAQSGRPDMAFRLWRELLAKSTPTDVWVTPIRAQIEEAAAWAGVDYTLPELAPALAGPDAAAMAAAAEMSNAERRDMVGNMVAQLSERLATQGGSAQEWAQLIGALGVLGETDRARAIWGEAQGVFAADAQALEMVRAAAKRAGVVE